MTQKNERWIDTASISMPKAGAYQGLGEAFSVSLFTGEAALKLPLAVSPYEGGAPELALTYSAAGGQGVFGQGFTLGLPSISRKTAQGIPRYDDRQDIIVSSQEGELVLHGAAERDGQLVSVYVPRREQAQSLFEYETGRETGSVWRVTTRDNTVLRFGEDGAVFSDPDAPDKVFCWLINESLDEKGNRITYHYTPEGDISEIRYGYRVDGAYSFAVRFSYRERHDPFRRHTSGFFIEKTKLCSQMEMVHQFDGLEQTVRRISFGYSEEGGSSRLCTMTPEGLRHTAQGVQSMRLPRLSLSYQPYQPEHATVDRLRYGDGTPISLDIRQLQFFDLWGDGLPGLLYGGHDGVFYCAPLGDGRYERPVPVARFPLDHEFDATITLESLEGDGQYQLVVRSGSRQGYYTCKKGAWAPFTPFQGWAAEGVGAAAESVDLEGDRRGHPCVILGNSLRYYPSLGRKGVAPAVVCPLPESFPSGDQGSKQQKVLFADVFGDGLPHRVRLQRNCVECWPNLGYGRFGERVVFKGAPIVEEAKFDVSHLFLADLDGSGPADLIYLRDNHIEIYRNLGCSFDCVPVRVPLPVPYDSLTTVSFAALSGHGGDCMVLSRRGANAEHIVIDFTAGEKPYLLTGLENGMGGETALQYASSTMLYLKENKTWLSQTPYPVPLVTELTEADRIAGTIRQTRCAYRDAVYDYDERTFLGFAVAERWVTDEIPGLEPTTEPRHTRQFFYTGIAPEALSARYWKGDARAQTLGPSTFVISGERAEAEKALYGKQLREELYGQGETPCSVTQYQYTVMERFAPGEGRHGSYQVLDSQCLTAVYEQQADAPAVKHSLILTSDAYGAPRETCTVHYPHRDGGFSLSVLLEERAYQNRTQEVRHIGVLCEEKTWEVSGIASAELLTPEALIRQLAQAKRIPFGEPFPPGQTACRLTAWRQSLYWDDDLGAPLACGAAGRRVLLHHEAQAAFPEAYAPVTEVFSDREIAQTGGYLRMDGYWWATQSTHYYNDKLFFRPRKECWGELETQVDYDPYGLLPVELRQRVEGGWNTVHAQIDYQALQYCQVIDLNGNTTQAAFSPLGTIVAHTCFGDRDGAREGNGNIQGYVMREANRLEEVLASPEDFLQQMTAYYFCDLLAYEREGAPVCCVALSREQFVSRGGGGRRVQVSYVDGCGRVLEDKLRCDSRWLVKGRTVCSQSGAELFTYQPFYADTAAFEDAKSILPPIIMGYDASGRLVQKRVPRGGLPDGSFAYFDQKDAYTPWTHRHWNESQCVKDSDYYRQFFASYPDQAEQALEDQRDALEKSAVHHGDCTTVKLDNLGRQVARYVNSEAVTEYSWDAMGNLASVRDSRLKALGRYNIQSTYDMRGRLVESHSCDGGDTHLLEHITQQPACRVDGAGNRFFYRYDCLMRLTALELSGAGVLERTVYGETLPEPERQNLRGKACRCFDQAGLEEWEAFDLLGNPVSHSRTLLESSHLEEEGPYLWSGTEPPGGTRYTEAFCYDACSNLSAHTTPDAGQYRYHYDAMDRLTAVTGTDGPLVEEIRYTANSQRELVRYGNGVCTSCRHDPVSLLLLGATTSQETPEGRTTLQALTYSYDAAGVISRVRAPVEPLCSRKRGAEPMWDFRYDGENRIAQAQGRRQADPGRDFERMEPYTSSYQYDSGGNLVKIRRVCASDPYTKELVIEEGSNRLHTTPKGAYDYDVRGNCTQYPGLGVLTWNPQGQLQRAMRLTRPDGTFDGECYRYDQRGSRVWKLTKRMIAPGVWERTEYVYLGGYCLKRVSSGEEILRRGSLRVHTGETPCVTAYHWQKDTRGREAPEGRKALRYQVESLANSVGLELNETGALVTWEEYDPFGETTLRWGSEAELRRKERGFANKERDVTGFSYFEARYYSPYTGRMLSADGLEYVKTEDHLSVNLYAFCRNNPLCFADATGHDIYYVYHTDFRDKARSDLRALRAQYPNERIFYHHIASAGGAPAVANFVTAWNSMQPNTPAGAAAPGNWQEHLPAPAVAAAPAAAVPAAAPAAPTIPLVVFNTHANSQITLAPERVSVGNAHAGAGVIDLTTLQPPIAPQPVDTLVHLGCRSGVARLNQRSNTAQQWHTLMPAGRVIAPQNAVDSALRRRPLTIQGVPLADYTNYSVTGDGFREFGGAGRTGGRNPNYNSVVEVRNAFP